MADIINTITEKEKFSHIYSNYFSGNDVFIKSKNGNLKVQFLGSDANHVSFRIPGVKSLSETITVFARHNSSTIYAILKTFESQEDTFTFDTEKIQIVSEARREDRRLMESSSGGEKDILYVTGLVSDTVITNAVSMNHKKMETITETARFELEKRFPVNRIYFRENQGSDLRMNYFLKNLKPLYVADLNSNPEEKDADVFEYYVENIYKKDPQLKRGKGIISEATVPILYRKVIPYGYVQVNSPRAITDGLFEVVKRIAIVIDQLCAKNSIFAPLPAKFLVSDISRSGIGIVFREKNLAGFFRTGSSIIFETMLPTRKKAIMGAVIRNVNFLDGDIIKVGVEINRIDKTSLANVNEYLDKIGI